MTTADMMPLTIEICPYKKNIKNVLFDEIPMVYPEKQLGH